MKRDNQSVLLFLASFFLGYFISLAIHKYNFLHPLTGNGHHQQVTRTNSGNAKYIVYGTMKCPYTVKQVEVFTKQNIPYTFIDTQTPQGSKQLTQVTQGENTGVPVVVNPANNKFVVGFHPSLQALDDKLV